MDDSEALLSSNPIPAPEPTRSTPLDDPNATLEPSPPLGLPPPRERKKPPGLRDQLGATKDAAIALVMAHVELAKAEAGSIAGEVGRVAALGAIAIVLVIFAVFLFVIGVSLGVGEWVLGSMGWGVIHGVLLFLSVAMAAIIIALGTSGRRVGVALLVSIVVAILVSIILGLNLPNQLYTAIGDATGLAVDPGVRPLLIGMLLTGAVGLLAGIAAAVMLEASASGRFVALAGLTALGVAVGAFTAITFGPQVGAGIGITAGYITWMVMMGVDVMRTGIDLETLKRRFYPVQTIDTSKETLEWLQKRMPPGIGS